MSEFKVKEVTLDEEKSVQEIEQQLVEEHEGKVGAEQEEQAQTDQAQEEQAQVELREEDVLSFIKNRYNKEITTFDELLAERETQPELPEDVSAFLKYKKETGRGFEDFVKINRDIESEDPNNLLLEYYKQTSPDLEEEDITFDMSLRFGYDEDLDDEVEVKKKKLEMKRELSKAKDFFKKQKEQYMVPLESRDAVVPESEKEFYEAFKSQAQKARDLEQEQQKRQEFYQQKTTEVFSNDFKGFEFDLGEAKVAFKPAEPETLKKSHSDLSHFFGKFIDESGYIKDAPAYHRAMAVAMNPDSFAKFFYDKGKSDAVVDIARESKNIDMGGARSAPETSSKTGFKVTVLDSESSGRLKIKSKQ
jgi:hypothetical protein